MSSRILNRLCFYSNRITNYLMDCTPLMLKLDYSPIALRILWSLV
uniref:Uncharacterized protein n=1 Tax=Solanum lycopersicum TaxID=4081 RepID=A0A3Q7ITE1_SOLLC